MVAPLSVAMVRDLYAYDRWANARLLDAAAALPPAEHTRDLGAHWTARTLKGVFVHLLAGHALWLARFEGAAPTRVLEDAEFPDLPAVRDRLATVEQGLRAFVEGLAEADLRRLVRYRSTEGVPYALPLWPLLQHLANHATHHRSEASTMLTLLAGQGPPSTDLVVYHLIASGQLGA